MLWVENLLLASIFYESIKKRITFFLGKSDSFKSLEVGFL